MRCNDCRVCCQIKTFTVNLTDEDDVDSFRTYQDDGVTYVAKSRSGACVYLKPHGCSIYDRRPKVCRGFDCWRFLHPTYWNKHNVTTWAETITPLRNAAKALIGRHKQSIARRFNDALKG